VTWVCNSDKCPNIRQILFNLMPHVSGSRYVVMGRTRRKPGAGPGDDHARKEHPGASATHPLQRHPAATL